MGNNCSACSDSVSSAHEKTLINTVQSVPLIRKYDEIKIKFNRTGVIVPWQYHSGKQSVSELQQYVINTFDLHSQLFWLRCNNIHQNEYKTGIYDDHDLQKALQYIADNNIDHLELLVIESVPIPLNQWSADDICATIARWIHNDIQHKSLCAETTEILNNHELFGDKLNYLSADDLKCIVKDETLQFVTRDTLHVMFSGCDLDAQSVEQIATILCRYPLIKLLLQIQEQQVDGRKLIHMLIKDTSNALNIKTETGWTDDDVEQIRLLVLKHMVLSQNEFMNKMENICKSTNTDHILQQILQLNELDMEQIQYDIKRNRDVHEFSDMVIEAVDQLLEQTPSDDVEVHTIYSTIAKCFVCDDHDHYLNDW
eukprot:1037058_1